MSEKVRDFKILQQIRKETYEAEYTAQKNGDPNIYCLKEINIRDSPKFGFV